MPLQTAGPADITFLRAYKLKGKGAAEFGGEKREWDIEGKRQKNDKS